MYVWNIENNGNNEVNRHYHQYHGQSNRTSQTHCDFTDKNNNISFETFKWDLQKLMLLFLLATSHDVTLTDNIQYQSQFIVTDNNSRWDERKNVQITDKHVFFFKWYDNCLSIIDSTGCILFLFISWSWE